MKVLIDLRSDGGKTLHYLGDKPRRRANEFPRNVLATLYTAEESGLGAPRVQIDEMPEDNPHGGRFVTLTLEEARELGEALAAITTVRL